MGPYQVLPLWVRVDLGVMAMKGILHIPYIFKTEASSSDSYLLSSGFNFVLVGEFNTNYLESEFRKLRQRSHGAYFITDQNVIENFHIEKKKHVDIKEYNLNSGHNCSRCGYLLDEMVCQTFDVIRIWNKDF